MILSKYDIAKKVVFFQTDKSDVVFYKIPGFSCSHCVKRVFYSAIVLKCTDMCIVHCASTVLECSCCRIHRNVAAPNKNMSDYAAIQHQLYRIVCQLTGDKQTLFVAPSCPPAEIVFSWKGQMTDIASSLPMIRQTKSAATSQTPIQTKRCVCPSGHNRKWGPFKSI